MYGRGIDVSGARKLAAASLTLVVGTSACRSPTEVSLDLSTDVPCATFTGAAITVGSASSAETKAPATTTSTCSTSGTIGSLVIVPSGSDDDEITIRVAGGVNRDPETCTDDAASLAGCIVSRRAVRFIEHTPLTLDVPLRSTCIGVVCAASQTCLDGACVSDQVPSGCGADGTACGEAQLDLDGGVVADATTGDATVDGGPDPTAEGGPFPVDAADAAAVVDGGDAGDAGVVIVPPTCQDGTEVGALWPVTGRCGNHDSHTTLPGVTTGTQTCSSGTGIGVDGGLVAGGLGPGTVEAPLAIDAAGFVYTGDNSGTLRIYDAALTLQQTISIDTGTISSIAIASATHLYVASARAVTLVNLAPGSGTLTNLGVNQVAVPLVIAANGDLVVAQPGAVVGYGAQFPTPAWRSGTGAASPDAGASSVAGLATTTTGLLVSLTSPSSSLFATTADGTNPVSLSSLEPTGTVFVDPANAARQYTWNSPGLALAAGDETDIIGIVGTALTGTAIAVTSNPTTQLGMFSLFDPVTIKPIVQTETAQGVTVLSAPAVDGNGTIYWLTSDSKLHVRHVDGTDHPLVTPPLTAATAPPPIIGNGAVYIGGLSGGGVCMYK